MQKILFIDDSYTQTVNSYLEHGWNVVSISPVMNCAGKHTTTWCGAYVVIEKSKENEDE